MTGQDAERYAEKLVELIDAEVDQNKIKQFTKLLKELQTCQVILEAYPSSKKTSEVDLPAVIRKVQRALESAK